MQHLLSPSRVLTGGTTPPSAKAAPPSHMPRHEFVTGAMKEMKDMMLGQNEAVLQQEIA